MKRILIAIAVAGCTSNEPQAPFELAGDFPVPLDLALDGSTLYSLHYDNSIHATPIDGTPGWQVVAATKPVQTNEILVEPQGFNLLVAPPFIYWTAPTSERYEVRRASLVAGQLATSIEVLDASLLPFPDLARVGDRVCWTAETQIACALPTGDVTTLVALRARPQMLVDAGGVVYWGERGLLDSGTGGLYSIDMGTGQVSDVVTSLHTPTGVALLGDNLHWLDGGTCTRDGGLCYGNHDASVHFVSLTAPVVIIEHSDLGSFDSDDLVVAGDGVYYAADGAVWRSGPRPGLTDGMIAKQRCLALAATETTVYCATSGALPDGHIIAIPL